jgi:hypothetical protein
MISNYKRGVGANSDYMPNLTKKSVLLETAQELDNYNNNLVLSGTLCFRIAFLQNHANKNIEVRREYACTATEYKCVRTFI